ncbi:MAG: peptidylprolyl isomerase [Gemmatimonadota bacterium]
MAVVAAGALVAAGAACGEGGSSRSGESGETDEPAPVAAPAAQVGKVSAESPRVRLETTKGDILLALYETEAPVTVANFLAYVREGFYDGLVFHRVIRDFMIQGGGFDAELELREPTKAPIRNESDSRLGNFRGTIAMARTNDPHSASSQFFINEVDNEFLDHEAQGHGRWGYAVFGRVIEGLEVVDSIAAVETGVRAGNQGPMQDVPVEPVVIRRAVLVEP